MDRRHRQDDAAQRAQGHGARRRSALRRRPRHGSRLRQEVHGLWATDKGLWVNTLGSGEVYLLDAKGERSAIQKVAGLLDGLYVNGDDLWVSSWETSGVLHGTVGGELSLAQGGLKAPADFACDTKRKLVVVPLFNDNKIVAYNL